MMLDDSFFDRDCALVAQSLVGKVLRRRVDDVWLGAAIVETEAYYRREKGSHASLGRAPSRESLFMPPGTIYMYHSRAGPSLNVSCRGDGDAVLIKAARPVEDAHTSPDALSRMHALNPGTGGGRRRDHRLCAGQTLVCRSLALDVRGFDGTRFDEGRFFIDDTGYRPRALLVTPRLGIPEGRDEHLELRFVDADHARCATRPARGAKIIEVPRD